MKGLQPMSKKRSRRGAAAKGERRKGLRARREHSRPPASPALTPDADAMTCPVWEYREVADQIAGDSDLTADQALSQLLAAPIRMLDEHGVPGSLVWNSRVDTVLPATLAAKAKCSLDEWLAGIEVMHQGGFMSWDEDALAHYLSQPTPDGPRRVVFSDCLNTR